MQAVSTLYAEILRDTRHRKEVKLLVNGTEVPMSNIIELKTSGGLFESVGIGHSISRQISAQFAPVGEIPRMAEIRPYVRVRLDEQVSEWIPKGVFYIDTRQSDDVSGALTLHGYDAMLKSSPNYIDVDERSGMWPRKCRIVVENIAYRMGVELDERTVLQEYDVGYMPLTSGREILGWIAAMHGGNWTITDEGKLRLVPLVPAGDGIYLGREIAQLETAPEFTPFTGVQFYYEDKDTIFAGTDEGRVLEIECPWATQEIANAVLEQVRGYVYRPYEATGAILDPAAELGDPITVSGTGSVLASCDTTFNALMVSDIAAPEDEEIDHEYPYEDPNRNRTRREIAQAKADINIGVDNIRASVEDIDGRATMIQQTVDGITLSVTNSSSTDGQTTAKITLKVGPNSYSGYIKLDGNVDVSGQLSADALYAALGDIADLTVDRLSTSRRIVKYLAGDTSDDNFVRIHDQYIEFVSGVYADGSEQASNPHGALLYWESDPEGASIGSDGYPYVDGERIFTTTTETNWPVMVYKYTELVKRSIAFEKQGDHYVPVDVFGAGDPEGRQKGRLIKDTDGLQLTYETHAGKTLGIRMGDAGYTDIVGLRKPTEINFAEWDSGRFYERIDGDDTRYDRNVEFDAQERPVKITDESGHETTITW